MQISNDDIDAVVAKISLKDGSPIKRCFQRYNNINYKTCTYILKSSLLMTK